MHDRTAGVDPYLLEQLPTLPGTAVAFLRLCDDPTAGVADVAKVAARDPALLARILQVANSPYYGTREPIADVVRASASDSQESAGSSSDNRRRVAVGSASPAAAIAFCSCSRRQCWVRVRTS